jgi:hypothetical protein
MPDFKLSDLGPANAVLYLADRVLRRLTGSRAFLQRYYLVTQPVDVPVRLPRRLGAGLDAHLLGPEDPRLGDLPGRSAVLGARFAQASECLALYQGPVLAGFVWLTGGAYEEDEVRCRFEPAPAGSTAWDYDLYVMPGHRSGVAFMKLWSAAMEHLRGRGVRWSASRISAFAPASLASHRRLGALRVGQAFFVVLGRFQLMLATLPPYVHLSLGPGSRPTVRVAPPSGAA